jgi:hypothetical protein
MTDIITQIIENNINKLKLDDPYDIIINNSIYISEHYKSGSGRFVNIYYDYDYNIINIISKETIGNRNSYGYDLCVIDLQKELRMYTINNILK